MKKIILLSGLAMFAGCSRLAPTTQGANEPVATSAQANAATVSGTPAPGTYQVRMPGGKTGTTTISADGTYVDATGGKETERGRVVAREGNICFTPAGGTETCFIEGPPRANGGLITIGANGEKNTIRPPAAR